MADTFKIKGLVAEDFINYKQPSMFIISSMCDWKCCHEGGFDESICQNQPMARMPVKEIPLKSFYDAYINNDITKAIVIGGLEPMLQFDEVLSLIKYFREHNCQDMFVIYTGYYKEEIREQIAQLISYKNIIIKFGRYIPNNTPHFDEVLGINLVSNNQYGEQIC